MNFWSTPDPETLEDLLSAEKFYIRLVGELHPNRREPVIIISLRLINQLFYYIKRFEDGRIGTFYGRQDRRKESVEITGFDFLKLENQQCQEYPKFDNNKLGKWLASNEVIDDFEIFLRAHTEVKDAELVWRLPVGIEQLTDGQKQYGLWRKKNKNSSYDGPFGYFLYDSAEIDLWETQTAHRGFSEKPTLSLMDKIRGEQSVSGGPVGEIKDSEKLGKPQKRLEPKRIEKRAVAPPKMKTVIQVKNGEKTAEPAASEPDIRITKDEIDSTQSFPFLKGYTCYHSEYYEIHSLIHNKLKECDESLFIPRTFIQEMFRYPRTRFDDNVIAYLFGKPNAEGKNINYVVDRMDFISYHDPFIEFIKQCSSFVFEVLLGKKRYQNQPAVNSWILYTSRERIGQRRTSFDVYSDLLRKTRIGSAQLGVIIIDNYNVEHRRKVLDSEGGFEISAFIRRQNSSLMQYFPRDKFFIYQRKR